MKRYTYPAVVYHEDGIFALHVSDLNLVASGNSIEEVFEQTIVQLELFLNCSVHLEYEIPEPSAFTDVAKGKPKNVVLLVTEVVRR